MVEGPFDSSSEATMVGGGGGGGGGEEEKGRKKEGFVFCFLFFVFLPLDRQMESKPIISLLRKIRFENVFLFFLILFHCFSALPFPSFTKKHTTQTKQQQQQQQQQQTTTTTTKNGTRRPRPLLLHQPQPFLERLNIPLHFWWRFRLSRHKDFKKRWF